MGQGDVWRVVGEWSQEGGEVAQWVWHYVQTSSGGDPDAQDLIDDIVTNLETAWDEIEANVGSGVTFTEAILSQWDSMLNEWNQVATGSSSNLDGSAAGDLLPQFNAALITFRTEVGRLNAKKFLFGLDDALEDEGIWTAAFLTNMSDFAAVFDNDITSGGLTFRPCTFNTTTENVSEFTGTNLTEANVTHQVRRRKGTGV